MFNRISHENQQTQGVMAREDWDVAPQNENRAMVGFATPFSIDGSNAAGSLELKIKAADPFTVSIFRLGYYQGYGARLIETLNQGEPYPAQPQPACLWAGSHTTVNCSNWTTTVLYTPGPEVPSGFYFARLITTEGPDAGKGRLIPFVVRDDTRRSAILFQFSDTTWQAYNLWTDDPLHPPTSRDAIGAFYYPDSYGGVVTHASYNRPFTGSAAFDTGYGFERFYENTYPAIRWLERLGADVSYTTGQAVAQDYRSTRSTPEASLLLPATPHARRLFLTVGHDEYWSQEQRNNIERARAAGVHLMFLSGNQLYWKIGWEGSETIVCEKTSNKIPPVTTTQERFTGRWSDVRYLPSPDPVDARGPENSTTGTVSAAMGEVDGEMLVSPDDGRLRFWRGTPFAEQGSLSFDMHDYRYETLGHECNFDIDNGYRPAGMIHLSSTPHWGTSLNFGVGDAARGQAMSYTHHLTLFRDHASGAYVFHGGAIDISKALDGFRKDPVESCNLEHDPPAQAFQRGLVNLFADMGLAQPATLPDSSWWIPSEQRPAPPASSILQIREPISVHTPVCICGEALAAAPARIAAIEISIGDDHWHPTVGTSNWHYWWTPPHSGTFQISSRAVDDWGTLEPQPPALSVQVQPAQGYAQNSQEFESLWGALASEDIRVVLEHKEIEVGSYFTAATDGLVYAVRFYCHRQANGPHHANLWLVLEAGPTLLASAVHSGGTGDGWCEMPFVQPVRTLAGATYIASIRSATGYCSTAALPASPGSLTFLRAGYNAAERDANGFIVPHSSAAGAPLTQPCDVAYLVEPLYQPTASMRSSLWPEEGVTPKALRVRNEAMTLGTVWSSELGGFITALRFFSPATRPTWQGALWGSDPQHPIKEVEGPGGATGIAGWHEIACNPPVPITAHTQYVVSYRVPAGIPYGVTDDYFVRAPVSSWPLRGHSGVSTTGAGRPEASVMSSRDACYFVDVVFCTRA